MKAWRLIEKKKNWGKGDDLNSGQKICAAIAINRAYPKTYQAEEAFCRLERVIGTENIPGWNDAPERTHAQVLAAMKKADV